jgi:raffinose/stachyose/melibiose transport system substrate-binding protein
MKPKTCESIKIILEFLLVTSLLLAGCAPATQTVAPQAPTAIPTEAAPAVATQAPTTAPIGPVTIVYWSSWNEGEPFQKVMAQAITDFEAANPNIKIEVTWAGRDILTKLSSAIAAGTSPDLVDHSADELWAALIKNDQTLPLDNALQEKAYNEDKKWSDIFVDGILKSYQFNGTTTFIPYEIVTSAFWYDQNVFNKYNITPPKTWSELLTLCDTLNARGIAPLGGDNDPWYNAYYFYWLSERILGPGEWYKAAGDKTGAAWDNPGFLQVAQKIQELGTRGCFQKGYEGNVYPAGQVDWSVGKSAMELVGSWLFNEVHETATSGFINSGFPFPEIEGGKGKLTDVESFLLGWVVFKNSKHPQEAIQFMKFATQQKYQTDVAKIAQNMAARKDVALPVELKDMKSMFETATTLFKPYDGVLADYGEWWTTIFNPLDDQLFFAKIKPEEFISKLKTQSIDYWSRAPATTVPIR